MGGVEADGELPMCQAPLLNIGHVPSHALLTAAAAGGHNHCPRFSNEATELRKGDCLRYKDSGAKTQTMATRVPSHARARSHSPRENALVSGKRTILPQYTVITSILPWHPSLSVSSNFYIKLLPPQLD